MLTREYIEAGHITRFVITRADLGWEVREERDNALVRQAHYSDWHRVERAMQTFERLRDHQPDSHHS
jgi:hypothetical protein